MIVPSINRIIPKHQRGRRLLRHNSVWKNFQIAAAIGGIGTVWRSTWRNRKGWLKVSTHCSDLLNIPSAQVSNRKFPFRFRYDNTFEMGTVIWCLNFSYFICYHKEIPLFWKLLVYVSLWYFVIDHDECCIQLSIALFQDSQTCNNWSILSDQKCSEKSSDWKKWNWKMSESKLCSIRSNDNIDEIWNKSYISENWTEE